MSICRKGDLPHVAEQFTKAGVAAQICAQRQRVDEEPDQVFNLSTITVGDGSAHNHIRLLRVVV